MKSKVTSPFETVNQESVAGDYNGSRLPFTPEVSIVSDAQYKWGVTGTMNAFVGSSLTYRSSDSTSFETAANRAPDYHLPPWASLDLRTGLADKNDHWRVMLFARNLTNKYYWTFAYDAVDVIERQAGRPLTYGVTVSFRP